MVSLNRFYTHRHERGISLMFVVVAIFALLGVSALAIDLVTLYVSKSEAQRIADAGALAGAKVLVDNGVTADPANSANQWDTACDLATVQAQTVANRGLVGGVAPGSVNVCFGYNGATCSAACPTSGTPGSGFGVNPQVGVTVHSATLPLFFAKIWGQKTATVSATSLAEGFNPSGTNIPVASKCVVPWLVANIDPVKSPPAGPTIPIIDTATGQIQNPGPAPAGIIGENFFLGCVAGGCTTLSTANHFSGPTRVSYYAIDLGTPAAIGPSCSAGGWSNYQKNIVACNPTPIACGTTVNLDATVTLNPATNQAPIDCLIGASAPGPGLGQDTLNTATFPLTMHAGSNNPLVTNTSIATGDTISSSRAVVTIPIYAATVGAAPTSPVTVIGFMQGFVANVTAGGGVGAGRPHIRVLNVSGCGPGALSSTVPPVGGNEASAVPVRLIRQ